MAEISETTPKTSRKKVLYVAASVALAALASWALQPWFHKSEDAVTVLVTVFSILAGFLAAVMAIVANDRVLRGRNWKQDTYYLRLIKNELLKYSVIFHIYLITLVLSFVVSLDDHWPTWSQFWLERGLLFSTTLGVLYSFQLPALISRKHIDAMEHQIRQRRAKETGESQD
ncbi:hypothetical protein QO259_10055 [Salinicola sp. JS01]|uniref:hypothetical protein n=1 Tax=Salinicola sp. JS01 TaxID=3050071 RepID=UPI00255B5E67|nr:hypothetical protein [Salinicola sp. JS01]WIX34955.1 hypothetical protein QO259_10055 [Salinicola sp. JS01]